jgi:hypothetical protein
MSLTKQTGHILDFTISGRQTNAYRVVVTHTGRRRLTILV